MNEKKKRMNECSDNIQYIPFSLADTLARQQTDICEISQFDIYKLILFSFF